MDAASTGQAAGHVVEATSGYDTVCVGLSGRPEGARIPFGTVTERVVHDVPSNLTLIRGS